ncbi:hypothetical protein ACHAWF_009736 [Thalassiosira exigua]
MDRAEEVPGGGGGSGRGFAGADRPPHPPPPSTSSRGGDSLGPGPAGAAGGKGASAGGGRGGGGHPPQRAPSHRRPPQRRDEPRQRPQPPSQPQQRPRSLVRPRPRASHPQASHPPQDRPLPPSTTSLDPTGMFRNRGRRRVGSGSGGASPPGARRDRPQHFESTNRQRRGFFPTSAPAPAAPLPRHGGASPPLFEADFSTAEFDSPPERRAKVEERGEEPEKDHPPGRLDGAAPDVASALAANPREGRGDASPLGDAGAKTGAGSNAASGPESNSSRLVFFRRDGGGGDVRSDAGSDVGSAVGSTISVMGSAAGDGESSSQCDEAKMAAVRRRMMRDVEEVSDEGGEDDENDVGEEDDRDEPADNLTKKNTDAPQSYASDQMRPPHPANGAADADADAMHRDVDVLDTTADSLSTIHHSNDASLNVTAVTNISHRSNDALNVTMERSADKTHDNDALNVSLEVNADTDTSLLDDPIVGDAVAGDFVRSIDEAVEGSDAGGGPRALDFSADSEGAGDEGEDGSDRASGDGLATTASHPNPRAPLAPRAPPPPAASARSADPPPRKRRTPTKSVAIDRAAAAAGRIPRLARQCFSFDDTTVDDDEFLAVPYGLSAVASHLDSPSKPPRAAARGGGGATGATRLLLGRAAAPRRRGTEGGGAPESPLRVVRRTRTWEDDPGGAKGAAAFDPWSPSSFARESPRREGDGRSRAVRWLEDGASRSRAIETERRRDFDWMDGKGFFELRCDGCRATNGEGASSGDGPCSGCAETTTTLAASLKGVGAASADRRSSVLDERARSAAVDALFRSYEFAREARGRLASSSGSTDDAEFGGRDEGGGGEGEGSSSSLRTKLLSAVRAVATKQEEIERLNNELSDCRAEIGRLRCRVSRVRVENAARCRFRFCSPETLVRCLSHGRRLGALGGARAAVRGVALAASQPGDVAVAQAGKSARSHVGALDGELARQTGRRTSWCTVSRDGRLVGSCTGTHSGWQTGRFDHLLCRSWPLHQPASLSANQSILSNSSGDEASDSSADRNGSLVLSSTRPSVKTSDSQDESFAKWEKSIETQMNLDARKEILLLKAALERANRRVAALSKEWTPEPEPFSSEIEPIRASSDDGVSEQLFLKIAEDIENEALDAPLSDDGVGSAVEEVDATPDIMLNDPALAKELEEYRAALITSLRAEESGRTARADSITSSEDMNLAHDSSKSSEVASDRKMINVRMIDGENFTTEWGDLAPALPPPPDHDLHSPIVDAILSKWTDDPDTRSALVGWVEKILDGSNMESIPSLKLSGLDHQIRDGFIMHVLPLLLRRKDVHVHLTSRAHRQTTYDIAVSVKRSISADHDAVAYAGSEDPDQQNRYAPRDDHHLMAFQATQSGASIKANESAQQSPVRRAPSLARPFLGRSMPDLDLVRAPSTAGSISTAVTSPISNRTPSRGGHIHGRNGYTSLSEMKKRNAFASPSLGDDLSVASSVDDDDEGSQRQSSIVGRAFGLLSRRKPAPDDSHGATRGVNGGHSSMFHTPTREARKSAFKSSDQDGHSYHRVVSAPPGKIGITFVEYRGHCLVSNVLEDSPLVGWVHPSDVLVAIDDVPVSGLRTRDIVKLLTNRVGQQRNLRMVSSVAMNDLNRPGTV